MLLEALILRNSLPAQLHDYIEVYPLSTGRHLNPPTGLPVIDRSAVYTETNNGGIFGSARPQPGISEWSIHTI